MAMFSKFYIAVIQKWDILTRQILLNFLKIQSVEMSSSSMAEDTLSLLSAQTTPALGKSLSIPNFSGSFIVILIGMFSLGWWLNSLKHPLRCKKD
jgi:hypothetical protein